MHERVRDPPPLPHTRSFFESDEKQPGEAFFELCHGFVFLVWRASKAGVLGSHKDFGLGVVQNGDAGSQNVAEFEWRFEAFGDAGYEAIESDFVLAAEHETLLSGQLPSGFVHLAAS